MIWTVFSHLLAAQVLSRLSTFVLNLIIVRICSPAVYGLASVQFQLINNVILFLSREGFRRGCLRIQEDAKSVQGAKKILATTALCLPLGLSVSCATCWLALRGNIAPEAASSTILLQGLAAMVELAGEPFFVLAQLQMRMRVRVLVETTANAAKGVATLLLLSLPAQYQPDPALSLSLAQVMYGCIIFGGYACASTPMLWRLGRQGWFRSRASSKQGKLGPPSATSLLNRDVLWLCASYTAQAGEKLMLQEGSRVVMVLCATSDSQGVYGLVTNLGSLVVRTLFQPLEEAAFLAFSQPHVPQHPPGKNRDGPLPASVSRASTGSATSRVSADGRASARDVCSDDQDGGRDAAEGTLIGKAGHEGHRRLLLSALTKLALLAGLTAVCFGPPYTYLLLRILYGRRWADGTEAAGALAAYCVYILFLAANGILEAYLHAVSDGRQIMASNVLLVAVSAVHLALSISLIRRLGVVGLIVADGANMALRVLYCLWFIAHTGPKLEQSCSAATPATTLAPAQSPSAGTSIQPPSADMYTRSMRGNASSSSSSSLSGDNRMRCAGVAAVVGRLWQDLTPASASLLSLILAAGILQTSGWMTGWAHAHGSGQSSSMAGSVAGLLGAAIHVGVGAITLLGVMYSVWLAEESLWQQLKILQGHGRHEKKQQ
ncbi:hypothetical protein WJX74_008655 [Apatococcus lobatus]|uniref:Protein RFT1 homolog n=1 Tax=Apatococcus lobatus TaxID=904363 RepID=A0AAW1QHG1_9CHLO